MQSLSSPQSNATSPLVITPNTNSPSESAGTTPSVPQRGANDRDNMKTSSPNNAALLASTSPNAVGNSNVAVGGGGGGNASNLNVSPYDTQVHSLDRSVELSQALGMHEEFPFPFLL
jgi:hypothetical protein